MTKQDSKVVEYFNLNKNSFLRHYAILLNEERRTTIKNVEIYAENLTKEEAEFGVELLLNDAEIVENRIKVTYRGMHILYTSLYLLEMQRLNRIECIKQLRRVILLGNVAKRLFRRNKGMYIGNIDKFISDYDL